MLGGPDFGHIISPYKEGVSRMNDKEKELLAGFHHTISEQLNSRLSESPKFFALLVVVSTAYGYVLTEKTQLFLAGSLLTLAATVWASFYLAALGYAFRFLQNCQHCIEHKLNWAPYTPGRTQQGNEKQRTGRPPKKIRTLRDVFWVLPGIYHAHAAGLGVFVLIICIASCRASWAWWPGQHCCIVVCGLIALLASWLLMLAVNVHYVWKYRDETWQDPTAFDPP
jgi:hypothetical protein